MNTDYRPRLTAELRPDQHRRLTEIIPRGMQKPLFQAIVDGVIELYERGGMEAIGLIIGKHVDITQITNLGYSHTKKVSQHGDDSPSK